MNVAPRVDVENRDVLDLTVRGSAETGGIAIGVPQTLVFFYSWFVFCFDFVDFVT